MPLKWVSGRDIGGGGCLSRVVGSRWWRLLLEGSMAYGAVTWCPSVLSVGGLLDRVEWGLLLLVLAWSKPWWSSLSSSKYVVIYCF